MLRYVLVLALATAVLADVPLLSCGGELDLQREACVISYSNGLSPFQETSVSVTSPGPFAPTTATPPCAASP